MKIQNNMCQFSGNEISILLTLAFTILIYVLFLFSLTNLFISFKLDRINRNVGEPHTEGKNCDK